MVSPYKNETGGGGGVSPRFVFIWKVNIILEKSDDFK